MVVCDPATGMNGVTFMKTQIIVVNHEKFEDDEILAAAEAIRAGKIVVFPTETVYGVGCRYGDKSARERIFALKERDRSKPLAIYLLTVEEIRDYAVWLPTAQELARAFLPGPLTLVLPGRSGGKLGFRIPSDAVIRRLISLSRTPLAGTSANVSGQESPTDGEQAIAAMDGRVDVIVNAGKTELACPSTVVDLCEEQPLLLREGFIRLDELSNVLNREVRKAF
jgi:L-threonylcarbamoyladenylate synthase